MTTVELRKLENSSNRPGPEDMKDSVQLEYDADIVMLVHNDRQVNPDSNVTWDGGSTLMPYIELNICKNKSNGQTKRLAYRMNSTNLRLTEVPYGEVTALMNKKREGVITSGRQY
jgi:replicative DNA helicase